MSSSRTGSSSDLPRQRSSFSENECLTQSVPTEPSGILSHHCFSSALHCGLSSTRSSKSRWSHGQALAFLHSAFPCITFGRSVRPNEPNPPLLFRSRCACFFRACPVRSEERRVG